MYSLFTCHTYHLVGQHIGNTWYACHTKPLSRLAIPSHLVRLPYLPTSGRLWLCFAQPQQRRVIVYCMQTRHTAKHAATRCNMLQHTCASFFVNPSMIMLTCHSATHSAPHCNTPATPSSQTPAWSASFYTAPNSSHPLVHTRYSSNA